MYKLLKDDVANKICAILKDGSTSIPICAENTDYANFKKEINAETVELQDAEGNTMTAAEAKAYVATLP